MLRKNVKKISIVMLIAIVLVVPTGFLVGASIPEPPDLTETEQKINGVRLRDYIKNFWTDYNYIPDPSESSSLPLTTTVQRFSTVHFEVTIRNLDDDALEIEDFVDELPANFVSLTNGNIAINKGTIDPHGGSDKTFDSVFLVEDKLLDATASAILTRITFSKTGVLAEINPGGSLVIEFDAVASDIIGPPIVADSIFEHRLLLQFISNRVTYSKGSGSFYGKVESDSYAEVKVSPNIKMEKQVALIKTPEDVQDGEPPKEDDGPKDYVEITDAKVGNQVEFLISIESPLGREGHNDRDYYFKELDITDNLPEELRYNSSDYQLEGAGGGTITENNGVIHGYFLGKITALYITILADVVCAGVGINNVYIDSKFSSDDLIVYVQGFQIHPAIGYNKADSAIVIVGGYASISVDKKVRDPESGLFVDTYDDMPPVIYKPGDTVDFEITIINNGDYDFTDVEITDVISAIFEEETDCTEMIYQNLPG